MAIFDSIRRRMARLALGRGAALAAIVLVAAGAVSRAGAQEASGGRRTTEKIDLIADLIYDSNVAGAGAYVASLRHIKPSDEIFTPAVSLDLAQRIGRQSVYLGGTVGYDFHRVNKVLNRERIDLKSGVVGRIGFCRGQVSGKYGRHQSELSSLELVGGLTGPSNIKNTETAKSLDLSATCGNSIGFAPNFSVSETWSNNTSIPFTQNDSRTLSASAGIVYQQPSFGELNFFGSYTRSDFVNRHFFIGTVIKDDGYEFYAGGVSFQRKIGARLLGNASVSYTSLHSYLAAGGNYNSLTYSANLNYRFDSKLGANLAFSHSTSPSGRIGATFSVNRTLMGEIDYSVTSRLRTKLGASYARHSYPHSTIPVGVDLTEEAINREFVGASYQLNRRLLVSFDSSYLRRVANSTGLSYSAVQAGVTVRTTF